MLKILGVIAGAAILILIAAWLKLRGPDIPYSTLEAKYAGAASHFVDLSGGYHVHYRDEGDPSLPLLVLLHGFGDSFTTWEGWVRELKPKFHVICLDFPGHGLTRAPDGYVLTTDGLVQAVEDLAVGAKLGHFALAGNSLGGGVAWSYALKYPPRLTALILVDAAGWPRKSSGSVPLAFMALRSSRVLIRCASPATWT